MRRSLFAVAVVATSAAVLAVMVDVGPAGAVVPGRNGRILFTRLNCIPTTGSEGIPAPVPGCPSESIVVADANDTNETVLLTDPSNTIFGFRLANWSPDGRIVIFARDTCGNNGGAGPSGIWTEHTDGTGLAQLIQAPEGTCFGEGPVYTPDGTQIVLRLCCVHGDSLWIMNSNGSDLHPLTSEPDGVRDSAPQVSPDGTRIAFNRCSDTCQVATVPLTGGTPQVLTSLLPLGVGDIDSNWSPDSKKIVFTASLNGCTSDIATINADGSGFMQLTFNPPCGLHPTAGSFQPSYSPDGTKIIFGHSLDTPGVDVELVDLFTMNPDGTGVKHVTHTAAPEFVPQWAVAT